jgi:hypothetical protein
MLLAMTEAYYFILVLNIFLPIFITGGSRGVGLDTFTIGIIVLGSYHLKRK